MSQHVLSASLILTERVVATLAGFFLHCAHTPSTVSCSHTGQCIVAKYWPIVPRGFLPPSATWAGALLTCGSSLYLQKCHKTKRQTKRCLVSTTIVFVGWIGKKCDHSPLPDINTQQWETTLQSWNQLLGDVVDAIQPQSRVIKKILWSSHQLDQWLTGCSINNHVRYSLPHPWLRATVNQQTLSYVRRTEQLWSCAYTVTKTAALLCISHLVSSRQGTDAPGR